MYRAGVCAILSQLAREDRLVVVDTFTLSAPKTKLLVEKLKGMGFDDVLIITDVLDDNLRLSARNLHHVSVASVSEADPVTLIRHEKIVVTKSAIAKIEEMLA
jgi:large subunit ribosomal protein L4